MDIKSLIRHAHRSAAELKRFTLPILENRVMLKTELGRGIRMGIGLRPKSLSQGAHWTGFTGFRKQRATRWAGAFGITVRIRIPVHVLKGFTYPDEADSGRGVKPTLKEKTMVRRTIAQEDRGESRSQHISVASQSTQMPWQQNHQVAA